MVKKPLLGNHQKCWIWGKHAVLETLKAERWTPYEVMLGESVEKSLFDKIQHYCERKNILLNQGTNSHLEKLCRHTDHQGMIAMMPPFPYTEFSQLKKIKRSSEVCVYLDGIQDPHNLGAIIRSADVLGIQAVLIPASGQVGVTNMVVKSSAGAVNAVPIIRLNDPVKDLTELKSNGYKLYGLAAEGEHELSTVTFPNKSIIMLGNEAEGINPQMMKLCDQLVKITVKGIVDSLNVAVTAGIVMYSAVNEKK